MSNLRRDGTWARAALFLTCFAAVPEAGADAIGPAPACPPGSYGSSSHAGQYCAAAACTTNDDCQKRGGTCRPWRVCVQDSMVTHHRRQRMPRKLEQVVGTCAPAEACKGDEEPPPPLVGKLQPGGPRCTTGKYCVPASLPPLPAPKPKPQKIEEEDDEEDDEEEPAHRAAPGTKSSGCGCRSSKPSAQLSLLGFFAFALLLVRRRRS